MKPHIKRGSSGSVRWWGRESGRKPRSRNPALNSSLKSSAWLTFRRSQECVRVTGGFVDREADDLSLGVDAARQNQREVRVRGDQVVEGAHLAVLPNEGAQVEVCVQRDPDDLRAVVDVQSCANEVS